ncbi:AMP-binding protein [Conexibacter sp. CPCC 206217]|uniref:AMP-binding protein n=1 Tax=Conexibacter sp. CPCC 206217 TaxID=3064574 RepID=UPI00272616DE|nr:AMP-binding protein [Conexibacter sp. CPCC 206217]MDO8208879.1 AMP-binding protein [Conexibacter sp. CPCC 206217]
MSAETLGTLLAGLAERRGDKELVRFDGGAPLTHDEVVGRAASLAAALRDAGLGPGDRVLMMLDNGPAFLDAWFACALGGLVMVPLNTRLQGRLLEDVATRSGARAVIADPDYVPLLDPLLDAGIPRAVTGTAPADASGGWLRHDALVEDRDAPLAPPSRPADPVSIIFTSGTTGPAKGVILSHGHCIARSGSYVRGLGLDRDDVMFSCLPLFHNNAQMATVLPALLAGGRVALHGRFSVSRFWSQISAAGATRFTLIGRMANLLLAADPRPDERTHAVRSACIVPPPRGGSAFTDRFGIRVVSQYYGATEMIPMPPDLDQPARPGSCGRPGPGYECAVVDPDGMPLPDGEVGELVARPLLPSGVMSGYLDMPQQTLEAFRGLWFHTGDAVRRDADGFYFLVGRLKEVIRHKGENISATEVERVVCELPGVHDAAVVGEPDEWGEERVVLYAEAGQLDAEQLRRECADRLPDFMVPAVVHIVEALPRNALGRVEKFKLRPPEREIA